MKYALFLLFSLCACLQGSAQQVEFKTFIYTSNDLGEEIAIGEQKGQRVSGRFVQCK